MLKEYTHNLEIIAGGTLRFWGKWYGRPFDNYHRVTSTDFNKNKNIITIHFSHAEKCTIYNLQNIINEKNKFCITGASKIEWEYESYGVIQPNNRKTVYTYIDEHTIEKTYSFSSNANHFDPQDNNAFEILSS